MCASLWVIKPIGEMKVTAGIFLHQQPTKRLCEV